MIPPRRVEDGSAVVLKALHADGLGGDTESADCADQHLALDLERLPTRGREVTDVEGALLVPHRFLEVGVELGLVCDLVVPVDSEPVLLNFGR